MDLRWSSKVQMRVEHDVKLTFDDVLIRPKRSTLVSRSDVTLVREFTFRHSDATWTGVPIVSANMDTTGLFSVAAELQKHQMMTCMQKFYSTKDYAMLGMMELTQNTLLLPVAQPIIRLIY